MDNYSKAKLKKKILRLVKRNVLQNKNIVLFGASVFSKEIKNCLLEHNIAIEAIVDNDTRKIGKIFMGLKVQKPEDILLPRNNNFAILMLSGGFYREMTYQLEQMGYVKNKNIFVLNFKFSENLLIVMLMSAKVIRGFVNYRKRTKNLSGNSAVFIAPYTGIGDIYLIGLFFNEYIRKNAIDSYAFVVISNACKKTAEMFGIRNIYVIKPTISDDIIIASLFLRTNWRVIVLNDGWLGESSQWIRGYKGLDFEKMFRYFVFRFNDNVPHELPPRNDNSKDVDKLFEKYGLVKGKTVVLSPYSNTLFDLPNDVLETIVNQCKERGYVACTNCAGAEKPVTGTKAVFFPINQAVEFMDSAGYFIGVRSGLCDIISTSSCKKIILYDRDGLFYKCSQRDYFSLEKMRLCNDAMELEYHDDLREEVVNRIFNVLT